MRTRMFQPRLRVPIAVLASRCSIDGEHLSLVLEAREALSTGAPAHDPVQESIDVSTPAATRAADDRFAWETIVRHCLAG